MITLQEMARKAVTYLEAHRRCRKHHVEHTGSNTYLLDFYSYLGEIEKGKELIEYLLSLIVPDGTSLVFYPGRLNQMNMSNNVIDTGAAVDTISRFAHMHRTSFSDEEHARITEALRRVVETYLKNAAVDKPITNQRLWGLTGVASFARYSGDVTLQRTVTQSMQASLPLMTVDGFFRYYPEAPLHGAFEGYDGITTFYQSRHTAFMYYALSQSDIPVGAYEEDLQKSLDALMAMYTKEGYKDLRLECKRWYWLSSYEVASHAFDVYALTHSPRPEAEILIHNALYQIRRHFFDGYLHSHIGAAINFQCPIFWTAHLAWLLRVPGIEERFNTADALLPFSYSFFGKEVMAHATPSKRFLLNARFQARNPTVGIYENGLPERTIWSLKIPNRPPALSFSVREVLNHTWYALRGGYVLEAFLRVVYFLRELFLMLLPRYSQAYGKIDLWRCVRTNQAITVEAMVSPASKYGTILTRVRKLVSIKL